MSRNLRLASATGDPVSKNHEKMKSEFVNENMTYMNACEKILGLYFVG